MRRVRAFTLIEVLVALVIVALGMSAVLASLSASANNTVVLREKSLARWVALNQIAVTRLSLQVPMIGMSEGDANFANGKWHWSQEVDNPGIVPGLLRITVRVRRADKTQSVSAGNSRASNTQGDSDDNVSYVTSVVGFRGDAIASASGEVPNWTGTDFNGGSNTIPGGTSGGGVQMPASTTTGSSTAPNTTTTTTTTTTSPGTAPSNDGTSTPSTGAGP